MTDTMTVETVLMSNIPARVVSFPVSPVGPRVFAAPTICLDVKRMVISHWGCMYFPSRQESQHCCIGGVYQLFPLFLSSPSSLLPQL